MGDGPGALTFFEANPATTIETVCGGAVGELFQQEFERVLKNALDSNTKPGAKRTLTLTFTVEVNDDRTEMDVTVEASSKLGGSLGATGRCYIGQRRSGEAVSVCHDPRQSMLFEQPTPPRRVLDDAPASKEVADVG